jgi:hypothetical protein
MKLLMRTAQPFLGQRANSAARAANVAKLPEFLGNGAELENAPSLSAVLRSLLDLRRNLVQPFLGTICPILIVSDIRFESIYLIVSSSKLIDQFLSDVTYLLEVSLSNPSRVLNKLKNSAPCSVHHIGFRPRSFLFRSIRDNGSNSSHRTLPTLLTIERLVWGS